MLATRQWRINSYPPCIADMIRLAKVDASVVMGHSAWKEFGREIAKGAKPILIVEVRVPESLKTFREYMKVLEEEARKCGYRATGSLGSIEYTMDASGAVSMKINGKEYGIFKDTRHLETALTRTMVDGEGIRYKAASVYDISDTYIPEYLWMKKGFTSAEVVHGEDGRPVMNSRGETKIRNTPGRQAHFQNHFPPVKAWEGDPGKMDELYKALVSVSEKNGVPVLEAKALESKGIYHRRPGPDCPHGCIEIREGLEAAERCHTLIHEMAHSGMHSLEKGGKDMENRTKEIQAESVAYAVSRHFGIESGDCSAAYLANWNAGLELKAVEESMEVIHAEVVRLALEVEEELASRGLNPDLTEKKPAGREEIKEACSHAAAFALDVESRLGVRQAEMGSFPGSVMKVKGIPGMMRREYKGTGRIEGWVSDIQEGIKELGKAGSRPEQEKIISRMDALERRVRGEEAYLDKLVGQIRDACGQERRPQREFLADPAGMLESMKGSYPQLASLSGAQLDYAANSRYIRQELSPLLDKNPGAFADAVYGRARAMDKAAAKNGCFVEVTACEQLTDRAFAQAGAMMHPSVAEAITGQAEAQIRGLKEEAKAEGSYFPYCRCWVDVFHKGSSGLEAFHKEIGIGDGQQGSLQDCIRDFAGKEAAEAYREALGEGPAAERIYFNEEPEEKEETEREAPAAAMDKSGWQAEITKLKAIEAAEAARLAAEKEAVKKKTRSRGVIRCSGYGRKRTGRRIQRPAARIKGKRTRYPSCTAWSLS